MTTWRKFETSEHGGLMPLFGIMLVVLLGFLGIALDYANARRIRIAEQSVGDATALMIAGSDTVLALDQAQQSVRGQLKKLVGDQVANATTVQASWIDAANYKLTVSYTLRTALAHLLPGVPREFQVSSTTVVNRVAPKYETRPPSSTFLSPEAADYNRIYLYCYSSDPARQRESDGGRRGLTPVGDNAEPPSDYSNRTLPTCGEKEAPSYMLRNVRLARANPRAWDDPNQEIYEYYTDTVIDTGSRVQTMAMQGYRVTPNRRTPRDMTHNPILETIICDGPANCKPRSQGGILPNNHETHDPQTASTGCIEGKFMYFGWEDRPPTDGSDRDYDDIRVLVSCPKLVQVEDKKLRIVR